MKLQSLSLVQLSLLWTLCLFLFPLLLLQGWYTRRTTVRLPDGKPPAEGCFDEDQDGDQPNIQIVGVGDSVIAGVGVSQMTESVTAQVAAELAATLGGGVSWRALGVNGEKSEELLVRLGEISVGRPDVFLVSIGVNDVTAVTGVLKWQFNIIKLLAELRDLRPGLVVLLGVPPMEYFSALPVPLRQVLGIRAAMLNHTLRQAAELLKDVCWVDLRDDFDSSHLASDGYHPNATACRDIAVHVASVVAEKLREAS